MGKFEDAVFSMVKQSADDQLRDKVDELVFHPALGKLIANHAQEFLDLMKALEKPVQDFLLIGTEDYDFWIKHLQERGIPILPEPEMKKFFKEGNDRYLMIIHTELKELFEGYERETFIEEANNHYQLVHEGKVREYLKHTSGEPSDAPH